MAEIPEELVDIPEPEDAVSPKAFDASAVDPGADTPPPPPTQPAFGEDPAYDPGGMGRQPSVADDEEDYGGP